MTESFADHTAKFNIVLPERLFRKGGMMDLSALDVGSLVAIGGLIVTVIKLYLDQRKAKKEIELSKQYIQTLSKLVESYVKSQESQQQFDKQKLDWQKLKDIAKGLWEVAKSEDEEE